MSPEEIFSPFSLWIVKLCLYSFCLYFILHFHVWIRIRISNTYGSRSTKLLNTDTIRIRIHNPMLNWLCHEIFVFTWIGALVDVIHNPGKGARVERFGHGMAMLTRLVQLERDLGHVAADVDLPHQRHLHDWSIFNQSESLLSRNGWSHLPCQVINTWLTDF